MGKDSINLLNLSIILIFVMMKANEAGGEKSTEKKLFAVELSRG